MDYNEEPDDGGWHVMGAVTAAIACILAIAALAFIVADSTPEPAQEAQTDAPSCALYLDCTNAALMHSWGLPTKADVVEWHVHGQWGYYEDGRLCAFDELPGRSERWDMLYGIEPNPAFDK
ncbi:MAG: hypothetical protein IJ111_13480 [Eggerthellaceae bacterium]|nr:hypothetical protein [Eggerthellaceae bacterium]